MDWNYYTTTFAPDLPSAKPTYINILSDIAPDGLHSSSFATDYETNFAGSRNARLIDQKGEELRILFVVILGSTSFLSLSYNEARKTLFLACAIASGR